MLGCDVSRWQTVINWQTAKNAGAKFAIIKCSQGTTIKDAYFDANWAGSGAVGLPRSPYHYYIANQPPIAQMDKFLNSDQGLGELPHVVDIEDPYNIPSPTTYAANVKLALEYLTEQIGRLPMIYTRSSYWKVYLYKAMGWADRYPLWVAHYKDYLGPIVCLPWSPNTWSVWQFTSSGPGTKYGVGSLEIDLDVTNGNLPAVVAVSKAALSMLRQPAVDVPEIKPGIKDILEEKAWQHKLKGYNPRRD